VTGTQRCGDHGPAEVAVVVPVFGNAATLSELARRLAATLPREDLRVVFVDDGSPDDSWEVVRRLAGADPRVAGLRLARNTGQHAAVLAGLAAVPARWYVVMDADLQDPPEAVPALLVRARATDATVFARRLGRYERWDRLVTSRLFKTLLSWVSGVPADVGTFFVVGERTAAAMVAVDVTPPQVVVLAHHCSPRRDTIAVERARRPSGRSAYSSLGRMRAALHALRCAAACQRGARSG
jgi:hypothetical protein